MNAVANNPGTNLQPVQYWRLWLFDTVLVSAGFLFFLATRYGSYEFFGKACAMALLPLIPVMVLVGGAGSTVFALTKVWVEKRSLNRQAGLALLIGPALALTLALGLLGVLKSPAHRLAYVCAGHAPGSASQVRISGYSTFLREEWLAVFQVNPDDFKTFVPETKLESVPEYEFHTMLEHSWLKQTGVFRDLPPSDGWIYFRRVFNEGEEHQRGRIYAAFDSATATAIVFRGYWD